MTTDHYEWIQSRMRDEIKGNHTSSIWLALALCVASVGASFLVTVMSTPLAPATKGKLEVVCWAALVTFCMLLAFHFAKWKDSDKRATALLKEMDLHRFDASGASRILN